MNRKRQAGYDYIIFRECSINMSLLNTIDVNENFYHHRKLQ